MNPETECIEEDFHIWKAGTHREEIWHWFDQRYSKGVVYLLYGIDVDRIECDSMTCHYNHSGECRFTLVHERKPRITDSDGCIDFDYIEGEC